MSTSPRTELSIIGFMNAYTTGRSGGDVAFIEIFKRWQQAERSIVSSALGAELCQAMGLNCNFVLSTHERSWNNVFFTYFLRIINGISKVLGIKKVDIIYISSDILADVLPAFALYLKFLLLGKKPKVIAKSYHINSSRRFVSSIFQRISLLFLARFADYIITSSASSHQALCRQGLPVSKVRVNPLGIDFKALSGAASDIGLTKKNQIVCLGRIHPAKGIYEFIEIWSELVKLAPDAQLVFVGSGSDEHKQILLDKIKEFKLEKSVFMAGFLSDQEKIEILKSSKALVLPSREEGFSLAILEAFACGLPALAFDLPVLRELFFPELIVIPLSQPMQFVEALLKLLATDVKSAEGTAQCLILKARSFDWDQCAKREWDIVMSSLVAGQDVRREPYLVKR